MALPEEKFKADQVSRQDLTKEYVAGTGFWSTRIGQVLSNFADDLEWLISTDVYERMARDPVVSKNLQYQKLSVTSEGVQLQPAVTDEKDPEYAKAQEIRDFEQRNMDGLHRPITQIIEEMMNALKRAHTVAEITYNEPSSIGVDAYKLTLKSIKVKPRNTTAFVIDAYRNVLGLTAWLYGQAGTVPSSQIANGQKVIPREKFAVLTFETEDEDPRGVNSLRPAYNYWQAKCLVPGLRLVWLEKSGVPSIVGFTAPNAEDEQETDSNGDAIAGGAVRSAQEAMAHVLSKLTSASSAGFPDGAKIQVVEVSGNGSQFTRAERDFDQQIDYAMTLQSGATKDSETGSYSSKTVFKDVLDVLVWSRKQRVAQMLYSDVFKRDVEYNFGKEYIHLTPRVIIGDPEQKDWADTATALALIAPYLTDSQWDALCSEIGVPAPLANEIRPSRAKVAPVTSDDESATGDKPKEGGLKK